MPTPQKIALVTGAGSGIGQAIARLFAAQGASVWVVDRDGPAGRHTVDGINSAENVAGANVAGAEAALAELDVSDPAAVLALAARLPPLDILVNNAGVGHVGDLLGTAAADLDRLYAVNVRGPFNLCKAFVPAMIKKNWDIGRFPLDGQTLDVLLEETNMDTSGLVYIPILQIQKLINPLY